MEKVLMIEKVGDRYYFSEEVDGEQKSWGWFYETHHHATLVTYNRLGFKITYILRGW